MKRENILIVFNQPSRRGQMVFQPVQGSYTERLSWTPNLCSARGQQKTYDACAHQENEPAPSLSYIGSVVIVLVHQLNIFACSLIDM